MSLSIHEYNEQDYEKVIIIKDIEFLFLPIKNIDLIYI